MLSEAIYRAQCHCNIHLFLHDRAGTCAIYYIKTKCCLSVGTFWHARSFAVSPRIRTKFARNEAPILGEHGVRFRMVLIHVVRRLQRFKCQGVDDSCRNFNQNSCKTAAQIH